VRYSLLSTHQQQQQGTPTSTVPKESPRPADIADDDSHTDDGSKRPSHHEEAITTTEISALPEEQFVDDTSMILPWGLQIEHEWIVMNGTTTNATSNCKIICRKHSW